MEHIKKDTLFTHQQKNVLIALLSCTTVFVLVFGFMSPPRASTSEAGWIKQYGNSSSNLWDRAREAGSGQQAAGVQTSPDLNTSSSDPGQSQTSITSQMAGIECERLYRKLLTAVANYKDGISGFGSIVDAAEAYAACESMDLADVLREVVGPLIN